LVALAWLCGACTSGGSEGVPRLPSGTAGKILARAIDAAGGWQRWHALHDVAYVNTLTLLDPDGDVTSQSIGFYMAPLHHGMQARMHSIGLPNEVVLGANGPDTWIVRDGVPVSEPQRMELTRFNLVSNLFWFSLPFTLAEWPGTVTDLGTADGEDKVRWNRLKVVFDPGNPGVPGDWFVLYINARTGLIDRVHARLTATFLRQELWVGKWLEYRDLDGLKKERRRKFYPADDNGTILGALVADQLVEHVRLNNGYSSELFKRPSAAGATRLPAVYHPNPSGRMGNVEW
jgi:hypothetical protein